MGLLLCSICLNLLLLRIKMDVKKEERKTKKREMRRRRRAKGGGERREDSVGSPKNREKGLGM